MSTPVGGRPRRSAILVLPISAVAAALVAAAIALLDGRAEAQVPFTLVGIVAFATVGALIEIRRPGQVIGRICLLIGCGMAIAAALLVEAIGRRPGELSPLGAAMGVVGVTLFNLVLITSGPLLISRFPDGRARGTVASVVDGMLVVIGSLVVTHAFIPGRLEYEWAGGVTNPLGIDALADLVVRAAGLQDSLAMAMYLIVLCTAGVVFVRRYLGGTPTVRAQMRWFAASIGLTGTLLLLVIATSADPTLNGVVYMTWLVSLFLPPIAIGISILRYRLYDIDRIVSNAIGYGVVSVVLSAVFVSVNLVLVSVLSRLTAVEDNGIAVAVATLAAASLFNPVRKQVQRAVDHRFHRARYDAERTVAGLAARIRDEVDVTRLREDVVDVVVRSVEPTGAELWLRPGLTR